MARGRKLVPEVWLGTQLGWRPGREEGGKCAHTVCSQREAGVRLGAAGARIGAHEVKWLTQHVMYTSIQIRLIKDSRKGFDTSNSTEIY